MNFPVTANSLIEVNDKGSSSNNNDSKNIRVLILFHSFFFLCIQKEKWKRIKCKTYTNKPKQMNLKEKEGKITVETLIHVATYWKKAECKISAYLVYLPCTLLLGCSHISNFLSFSRWVCVFVS